MKPSWYLERQATEAKERERIMRTRVRTDKATVNSRETSSFIYRSLFLKFTSTPGDSTSAQRLPFIVNISAKALTLVTITEMGLLPMDTTTVPSGLARNIKGSGVKPSQASWYKGATTVTAKKTEWGSRVIRYAEADTAATQTFFSIPVSAPSGDFTPEDVTNKFKTVFGGTKKGTLLGAKNGRANLELEACSSFFAINT